MLYQANRLNETELLKLCSVHSTRKVCTLLKLNRSNYYRRKQVKPKLYSAKNSDLIQRIRTIFKISGNNYGSRRIQRALALENIYVGRYKIRRIMKNVSLRTSAIFDPFLLLLD
ncbi:IS3 family transposase [Proteus mirabilis]|uniref:IS3 family transposase n=1 Tax=Proteus mirabilis TaxID=584 RepID=UPI0009C0AB22